MPFYEYECTNCKFYVEALQKVSDAPLKQCPSCKKQTLKKLVSAPVFRLKGGGWYETDFKSDQEGKRNLAAGEEAPEAASTEKPADDKAKPAEAAQSSDKNADKKPAAAETSTAASSKSSKSKPAPRPAARSKAPSKAKPKAAKRASQRRR
ncbi:MAG TPA: zinc ribbon domain-containing protein [Steroidobacteraceae bacterium]|nr:zinc ribbon domain-containing protein [Steroidobacteraceae bacterium]